MNLPTKITTARIVLIVAMLISLFVLSFFNFGDAIMVGNTPINWVYLGTFIVFVVAASTDALDGYLARSRNEVTDLGKFLDPIADKMLVNSMLIFLAVPCIWASGQETIPVYCVIVMVIRDLVVDALRLIAVQKHKVIAANIFGKLKTIFQMVAIPAVMLNDWPFSYFDSSWPAQLRPSMLLVYLATAMSLVSGVIYVIQNWNVVKPDHKADLLKSLETKGLSLGSVESLTAGMFASSICEVPGASKSFLGSLVTYDPKEKVALADVNASSIEDKGVVSEDVAREMAEGGRKKLGVDICLSCTGNAGPTTCPGWGEVGDVYIAVSSASGTNVEKLSLKGDRNQIRAATVNKMVELALKNLEK